MNQRTWPVLLLAAAGWLGLIRPAEGQPPPPAAAPAGGQPTNPSHLPISDGGFDPKSAEELLTQRLRKLKDGRELEALKKLVEDFFKDKQFQDRLKDPKFLEELKKKVDANPDALANDPTVKPLLDKLRQQQGDLKGPSPELLEELKKQLGQMPSGTGSTPAPKQGETPTLPTKPQPNSPVSPPTPPPPPRASPLPQPPPAPPPAVAPHVDSSTWINRQLRGLTRGLLERMGDPRSSPWLRDILKGILDEKPGSDGWKIRPLEGNSWARRLEGLKDYLPSAGGLFDRLGGAVRDWQLPGIEANWVGPSLPSLPAMPADPDASAVGGGLTVLWLGLLAMAALLLWKLLGRYRLRTADARAQWRLGPWPVKPGSVYTREELVRAFEYLALLLLGPPARTCNHLEVAGQLGRQAALDVDRRRDAAQHLAQVYEKARYAPDDEPWPDVELASARRELCLLAGVAGP